MCDYCSWIDQVLARISTEEKPVKKRRRIYVDPVIIVHGGAGKIPQKLRDRMLFDVKNAAIESYSDLINGGRAVDAVERAICYMESNQYFNCAKGGSLDVNDEVVMDAAITTTRGAGCVGAVRDIEHPISLARKVLEETDHVLIVENGAQKLAIDLGFPILLPGTLNMLESEISGECGYDQSCSDENDSTIENEERKNCDSDCVINRSIQEESYHSISTDSTDIFNDPIILQVNGVGVVAYDRKKRFVSGTSTAGEAGKPIGSVSATGTVIGCGVYTDEYGCASVSGNDTCIYCCAPAKRIIKMVQNDTPIDIAVDTVLQNIKREYGECEIGVIAIDAKGRPCVSFKCMHFPWAYCYKGYLYYGCAQNEKFSEKVDVLERPLDCMCISSSEED